MSDTKTLTLGSGAELRLQIAPFSMANKLRKVLMGELKTVRVELDLDGLELEKEFTLADLTGKELNTIKDVVCQLASSDNVERCIWECMKNSGTTYAEAKIKDDTFEPFQARGDFLEAAWEVICFNVGPFFSSPKFGSLIRSAKKVEPAQE